jgi:hypothetical protein
MSIAFTRGYILSFRDVVLLEAEVGVHPGHREKAGRVTSALADCLVISSALG